MVRSDSSDDGAWSLSAPQCWHVVHVHLSMLLFFLHFASVSLRRVVCVRCEPRFVVVYVRLFSVCFEQIDVVSTKFRHVIARAFGVFWMPTVPSSVA